MGLGYSVFDPTASAWFFTCEMRGLDRQSPRDAPQGRGHTWGQLVCPLNADL